MKKLILVTSPPACGKTFISKKLAKALLYLLTGGLAFFVVTFTVYFFNLDMKLTSMIEPLLLKWYDRIPRNQHL